MIAAAFDQSLLDAIPVSQDALPLPAQQLIAELPGPTLLLMADGTVSMRNPQAEPLVRDLRRGGSKFANAVAATLDDRKARQDSFSIAGESGRLSFDVSLIPTAEQPMRLLIVARDVTLERNLTQALVGSRQLFKDLVACSSEFAWQTRADGCFDFVSPQGALGYSARELEGRAARELLDSTKVHDANPFETGARQDSLEIWCRRKDGGLACLQVSCLPVTDAGGNWCGARGVCRDVTAARRRDAELVEAHAMLEQLSRTDELTGLLNRRAFAEELSRRLPHLRRHGRCGALLYIDLDNFKSVNDRHGHKRGDQALRSLAALMQQCSRAADLAGRLGGDEFVLWLEDTGRTGACAKARSLVEAASAMNAEFEIPGSPLGASIGIAVSGGEETIAQLFERADTAMYAAKRSGKHDVAVAPIE